MVHSSGGGWQDINVVAPEFLTGTICWGEREQIDWDMEYFDAGSGSTWHAKTPFAD